MDASLQPLWQQRLARARAVAARLRSVPFVRMVGLNGSLVTGTMTAKSDIDFYIATAPGRLYLTRAIVTIVVQLTGWRRYGQRIRGRICLNRFATTTALEITPHDDYHARVFSGLVPLLSVDDGYERYLVANRWMWGHSQPVGYRLLVPRVPDASWRRVLAERLLKGQLGDILEQVAGWHQRRRILRDRRSYYPLSRVFIRSNEICFHLYTK